MAQESNPFQTSSEVGAPPPELTNSDTFRCILNLNRIEKSRYASEKEILGFNLRLTDQSPWQGILLEGS